MTVPAHASNDHFVDIILDTPARKAVSAFNKTIQDYQTGVTTNSSHRAAFSAILECLESIKGNHREADGWLYAATDNEVEKALDKLLLAINDFAIVKKGVFGKESDLFKAKELLLNAQNQLLEEQRKRIEHLQQQNTFLAEDSMKKASTIDILTLEKEALSTRNSVLSSEIETSNKKNQELEQELKEVKSQITTYKNSNLKLENDCRSHLAALKSTQEQLRGAYETIKSLQEAQHNEIKQQEEAYQRRESLKEKQTAEQQVKIGKLEKNLSTAAQDTKEFNTLAGKAAAREVEAQEKVSKLEENNIALTQTVRLQIGQIEKLDTQIDCLKKELSETQKDLAELKEESQDLFQRRVDTLQKENSSLRAENSKLRQFVGKIAGIISQFSAFIKPFFGEKTAKEFEDFLKPYATSSDSAASKLKSSSEPTVATRKSAWAFPLFRGNHTHAADRNLNSAETDSAIYFSK
ncbi:MAG: hypothetical protein K0R12_894 [Gammaproteobacteria bacterium]|jgi:chromosome segregation ATPase|nr:hypothetical protein [Gammaproteobacteria bacterium]